MITVNWSDFKGLIASPNLTTKLVETGPAYYLWAFDGPMFIQTMIDRTGVSSDDLTDFETNYKATINQTIDPRDTDGVALSRVKQTTLGWTIQDHSFEFQLGTAGVFSQRYNAVNFIYTVQRFYELVAGVETLIVGANATDPSYLAANCVNTTVEWEPTHDYDIIGGEVRCSDTVTTNVRLWAVAVPDVPAVAGGSKELLAGGRNLKFISPKEAVVLDGRTTKRLPYNATYHTNKLRFIFRHDVGIAVPIAVALQFYKA